MKVTLAGKDKKIQELQETQNLFRRLPDLSVNKGVDFDIVFRYPFPPILLCLGHVDGSMNKTDKAKLMHKLEERVESSSPKEIDACTIDAMIFIQSLVNLPATFGEIAKLILTNLTASTKRIYFVCDLYTSPSIKDAERSCELDRKYVLSGPGTPKDFNVAPKSSCFKTALLKFLDIEWKKDEYSRTIKGHTLFVGLNRKAYL